MASLKNICIIPARGGSKRIPRKNIKHFLGKPIIAYSIEAALKSGLFDEVIVSTDDEEIAKVALSYGASIPFYRSAKNADDFATTFDVIEETLAELRKGGKTFQNACCLYACAPFVSSARIQEAYEKLIANQLDSVFPTMEYSFPIQRAMTIEADRVSLIDESHIVTRSQDLKPSYHDAGQFYWLDISKILKEKKLFTSNSGAIVISQMEGQDIDNVVDWELAELKYKLLLKNA